LKFYNNNAKIKAKIELYGGVFMGLLQKMVDSVHTSAQCQYMGGHPDWGTSGKGTLEVNNDKVNFKSGLLGIGGFQIPIKDVKGCSLQTQEQISHDVTLSRLLLFGVFAFGMKKKKVDTTRYLVITYTQNGIENSIVFQSDSVDILSSAIMKARQVYAKNHPEVQQQQTKSDNTQADDIPTQIKKLSDLKDQGILTKEEFETKKKDLLSKM